MEDVGSFASPNDPSDSAGAEFSWARNGISGNHALTAKGVLALSLVWETDKPLRNQLYLNTVTFAPYIVFDRLRNDIDTTKNIDDLAFGGTGELGYANFMNATHYLRFKGEVASSFDGGKAKNWAMAVEYQPFGNFEETGMGSLFNYLNTPIGVPGLQSVFFSVGPKLVTEYRTALEDDTDPIFSTRKAALRSGPTVSFGLGMDNIFETTPTLIQSVYYQVTWGWLWDWQSQRDYQLIDTSLTFNIDPGSHLGFTVSYTYGDVVATGKRTNVTKAGLSAKF